MITQAHMLHPDLSVQRLCELFGVSRSWYYEQLIATGQDEEETTLRDEIERIILEFPGYGYRRVTRALHRMGHCVNHKRVLRIMRQESLLCHAEEALCRQNDRLAPSHGWPDSFYRFHKVIPPLTDPARFGRDPQLSFDVIVPSHPGFGFSERRALNDDGLASLYATLMPQTLGYQQFVAAGGDVGANVIRSLALSRPDLLTGMHLSDVGYPDQSTDFASLTPAEQEFAQFIQQWWMKEGGFNMIQSTKPQTLSYGFNDSPAGMAAWMLTLIAGIQNKDEQLTNMTIYWATQTIGSSIRGYYENTHATLLHASSQRSSVPAGVIHAPWDAPLPREWAARRVNLVHFTEFPRGGHFMAWEEPELYVNDLVDFVSQLPHFSQK